MKVDDSWNLTPVLLLQCLERDDEAWSNLSDHYRPMLAAYASKLLSRKQGDLDGEQIACEVLERLFQDNCRLLRAFDTTRSFERYWMMLVRSGVRQRRRRPRKDDCHGILTDEVIPEQMDEVPWDLQMEDLRQLASQAEWRLVQKSLQAQPDGSPRPALTDAERQALKSLLARIGEQRFTVAAKKKKKLRMAYSRKGGVSAYMPC